MRAKEPVRTVSTTGSTSSPGRAPPPDAEALVAGMLAEQRMRREARSQTARELGGPDPAVPVTGVVSALRSAIVPSPHTTGALRNVEWALTLCAAPIFIGALPWLFIGVKKWGRIGAMDWIVGAIFSVLLLVPCLFTGVMPNEGWVWKVFGFFLLAYGARAVVRWWAYARNTMG